MDDNKKKKLHFRFITLIFDITLYSKEINLELNDGIKNASFSIKIRPIQELNEVYDETLQKISSYDNTIDSSKVILDTEAQDELSEIYPAADYFLQVDVCTPLQPFNRWPNPLWNRSTYFHFLENLPPQLREQCLESTKNFAEQINRDCLNTLNLFLPKTLILSRVNCIYIPNKSFTPQINELDYITRSNHFKFLSILDPCINYEDNVIKEENFKHVIETMKNLIKKEFHPSLAPKFEKLIFPYLKVLPSFTEISLRFLSLMIMFESLFKEESDRSLREASVRISKILTSTEEEENRIFEDFFNGYNSFRILRNKLVHGNIIEHLEFNAVYCPKTKNLFHYLKKAIIKLINMPKVDFINQDYYHALNNIGENL